MPARCGSVRAALCARSCAASSSTSGPRAGTQLTLTLSLNLWLSLILSPNLSLTLSLSLALTLTRHPAAALKADECSRSLTAAAAALVRGRPVEPTPACRPRLRAAHACVPTTPACRPRLCWEGLC